MTAARDQARTRGPVTAEDVCRSLRQCGVQEGDVLLAHSGLWSLGPISPGRQGPLQTFYEGVRSTLGESGTIAVSAAFLDYGRKRADYDVVRSPVEPDLGMFSDYVVKMPVAVRSLNPIAALAAVGPRAEWLCGGKTGSCFGADSPWERLHESQGKMAFIGVDLRFMTFVHYVEHRVGVPHLYSKFYPQGVYRDGVKLPVPVSAQVRYLDFGITYRSQEFTDIFTAAGLVRTSSLGRGRVFVAAAAEVYDYLKSELQRDFYFLLEKPPEFVPGKIPMDGASGAPRR